MVRKTFFRYGISNVYMMLVILVAFFAMFKGMDIYKGVEDIKSDGDRYAYAYTRMANISGLNIDGKVLNEIAGNFKSDFYCEWLVTTDSGANYRLSIYMKMSGIKLKFASGSLKAFKESNVPSVLIGCAVDKESYIKQGKRYILLNGSEYLVCGVLKSSRSDYFDNVIITDYERLSVVDKKNLDEAYYYDCVLLSDTPTINDYLAMEERLNEMYGDEVYVSESQVEHGLISEDTSNLKLLTLMFIFCIFNCVIAAEFYVYERREEIAIRKIYGFNNRDIFMVTYMDVLKISVLCAVLGLGIQFVSNAITYGADRAFNNISYKYLALVILSVMLSTFVIIFVPIIKASRKTAIKALGDI